MNSDFQRVLSLEGGCNFRDMGGYTTVDGRRVKQGQLYRSGVMAYFSEADKKYLAQLGIRAICDLRRATERQDEPTAWPAADQVKMVVWDDAPDIESQGQLAWQQAVSGEHARQIMTDLYRNMPVWLESRLRGVFQCIVSGDVPIVFHCAAGKDRTGLTAALVLHAMGVDRKSILYDYQLTNQAVNLEAFTLKYNKAAMGLTEQDNPMLKIPLNVRRALIDADSNFLSAALTEIEQDYQTIDNFLAERLGITAEVRAQIRDNLLTHN